MYWAPKNAVPQPLMGPKATATVVELHIQKDAIKLMVYFIAYIGMNTYIKHISFVSLSYLKVYLKWILLRIHLIIIALIISDSTVLLNYIKLCWAIINGTQHIFCVHIDIGKSFADTVRKGWNQILRMSMCLLVAYSTMYRWVSWTGLSMSKVLFKFLKHPNFFTTILP